MTNNSTLIIFKERSNVQYMIELSQKQINQIARSIYVLDIKAYIEQHRQEYEQFLEEEKNKNERSA